MRVFGEAEHPRRSSCSNRFMQLMMASRRGAVVHVLHLLEQAVEFRVAVVRRVLAARATLASAPFSRNMKFSGSG